MEFLRHRLIWLLLFYSALNMAQDRLYFRKGEYKEGRLVSVSRDWVFFKASDSSNVVSFSKNEILLIETQSGERYLFSQTASHNKPALIREPAKIENKNSIGMQPFGLLLGRVTFVYERLSKNGDFGLVLPFSLTFDPFGVFYNSADTNSGIPAHVPGFSYIIGCDLNYYLPDKGPSRFFMGPRFRYGTDQMLGGTEGFSVQFQLGWRFKTPKGLIQHFSVGYGFVRVLDVPPSSTINPLQLYAWYSANYRLSLSW